MHNLANTLYSEKLSYILTLNRNEDVFFFFRYSELWVSLSSSAYPQLFQQRCPNHPVSGHIHQLLQEDAELFPGQTTNAISPACPVSASGSPPYWTGAILTRCPNHVNWLLSIQRRSSRLSFSP